MTSECYVIDSEERASEEERKRVNQKDRVLEWNGT